MGLITAPDRKGRLTLGGGLAIALVAVHFFGPTVALPTIGWNLG